MSTYQHHKVDIGSKTEPCTFTNTFKDKLHYWSNTEQLNAIFALLLTNLICSKDMLVEYFMTMNYDK